MTRNFKEHPLYPGYYAGRDGYIYSLHGRGVQKTLKPFSILNLKRLSASPGSSGYLQVSVKTVAGDRVSRMVHKIISECFLKRGFDKSLTTSHKDGNRTNNKPSNLKMETLKKNHARKLQHGTDDRGYKNSRALISSKQLLEIRTMLANGGKHHHIAATFNVSRVFITKINNGYRYKNL